MEVTLRVEPARVEPVGVETSVCTRACMDLFVLIITAVSIIHHLSAKQMGTGTNGNGVYN